MSALEDFDAPAPVAEADMLGDRAGELVPTGHPGEPLLDGMDWRGKRFVTRDDGHPLIRGDGREADAAMGTASLRTIEDRGGVTATMVYDKHPIFDSFRRVDADTVMGSMDRKGEPAPLMFLQSRC